VGEGGLEPPRGFPHRNLNPARLPIPPLARRKQDTCLAMKSYGMGQSTLLRRES
jgi:hypothetical protein